MLVQTSPSPELQARYAEIDRFITFSETAEIGEVIALGAETNLPLMEITVLWSVLGFRHKEAVGCGLANESSSVRETLGDRINEWHRSRT